MDEVARVTTTQGDTSTLDRNHTAPDCTQTQEGSPHILQENSFVSSNQVYRSPEIFRKPSQYGRTGPAFYPASIQGSQTATISPRALVRKLAAQPGF